MTDPRDLGSQPPGDAVTTPFSGWIALTGQTISHYRILEKLGEGGMGVVYKAYDDKLHRAVALKFLPPYLNHDAELRRRLAQEARAASALDHPNIVVIYDIDVTPEGVMFVAMAFHDGETLQARMQNGLSIRDAVDIARQVALGLARAHEHGVFHRDIKPSNVIVARDGVARIIDFGLAKPADATATIGGMIQGTPLYMSPEQATGGVVDRRTDLWSLGTVLYEMLTSRRPFEGASNPQVMQAIATATPEPVRRLRPDVPAALAAIVDRALEKDPERRYQSAADMANDLAAFQTTLTATAAAPVQPARASRGVLVTSALVVTALVAAGGWFYLRSQRRSWARDEAIPQIATLMREDKALAAFQLLQRAEAVLPGDAALAAIDSRLTGVSTITSTPPGATVEIQDYLTPDAPWMALGTTPIDKIRLPNGYFRWRVSKAGSMRSRAHPRAWSPSTADDGRTWSGFWDGSDRTRCRPTTSIGSKSPTASFRSSWTRVATTIRSTGRSRSSATGARSHGRTRSRCCAIRRDAPGRRRGARDTTPTAERTTPCPA